MSNEASKNNNNVNDLITSLGEKFGLTGKEIADIFWLTLKRQEYSNINYTSSSQATKTINLSQPEENSNSEDKPTTSEASPTDSDKSSEQNQTPTQKSSNTASKANIIPRNRTSYNIGKTLPLRVENPSSLGKPLELLRSLKSLMRSIDSDTRVVLDEIKSVERSAATEGFFVPVLKPESELFLELALVVDESKSMLIWRSTILEIKTLLEGSGFFQDVRTWGMVAGETGEISFRPGIGKTANKQRSANYRELIEPNGRRLILIVSDCVAAGIWRNNNLNHILKHWTNTQPVAIIQMLPGRMWSRTNLNRGASVLLGSLAPFVANKELLIKELLLWKDIELNSGIKVPVFTLEPEVARNWSQMVAGKSDVNASGFVFPRELKVNLQLNSQKKSQNSQTEVDAQQRVKRFRNTASPMARKLASLLAAAPVITLPVVRLIQKTLLNESQQVHVAEVFLGGLLKPLTEIEVDTLPDTVEYDFMNDEIRGMLVEASPVKDSVDVLDVVSEYVAKSLGKSIKEFVALLKAPGETDDEQVKAFAQVAAIVLKRLGGEYADFAEELISGDEVELLYEAKLLIIGEGGAGKTSLAKKIEDENYQLKSDEESTQGIDVIQWKFPLENDQEFRVNIWDFGGQEIYHQTHQFFLSKRSLYILVVDTRREDTNLYWWIKVAELLSDKSPILIVQNEKQEQQCQIKESQLRGEFSNFKEVLSTNLATNRGLKEIKESIKYNITNLPHVGRELPKHSVEIRSAIEEDSRNYISREEYYQLCKKHNLTDYKDIHLLSGFLHDIGVFLHFQDDSTLMHYVILKPEWATTAVYKVLDNKTVRNNRGYFTQEELADIWKDSQYSDMRDELLQLMMRFKLCYRIPNRYGHYIAPQLLDFEPPSYTWDKFNNLILRYKYEFIPKGIITRFIVETHPWIEQGKLVWKSGVVLNKDETRAEIIESYNRREIKVRISGNHKKDLLTVVNYELEKINNSFERLQYQTLVPCNCSECIGSENPYTYSLENLRRRLEQGRDEIECANSFEMVDIRGLIDDVNLSQIQDTPLQQGQLQRELGNERNLNLNRGQIRKQLRDAIISAYPNKSDLKMMDRYELNVNLDSITTGETMEEIVFELIQWAEAQGKLEQLVKAACESNPGNQELQRIKKEMNL